MYEFGRVVYGENLRVLSDIETDSVDLIYIDPPFNTGTVQSRGVMSYRDTFSNYVGFMWPRLLQSKRILDKYGSIFLHVDYRESHYCKILLDTVFGRNSFMNEIIWAYDYGGRSRSRWPTKHDTIFWYAVSPNSYTFNYAEMDRIPYMAPGLVGEEKAALGKTPTDVWWHTIVPTRGKEKTGYPTQKPIGVIERIVKVHSNSGDMLLDFFAGSGTLGEAAAKNGRNFILVDNNYGAVTVMMRRLDKYRPEYVEYK